MILCGIQNRNVIMVIHAMRLHREVPTKGERKESKEV